MYTAAHTGEPSEYSAGEHYKSFNDVRLWEHGCTPPLSLSLSWKWWGWWIVEGIFQIPSILNKEASSCQMQSPNTFDFKQRSIVLSNAIPPPPPPATFPPLPSSSHRCKIWRLYQSVGEKKKKGKRSILCKHAYSCFPYWQAFVTRHLGVYT